MKLKILRWLLKHCRWAFYQLGYWRCQNGLVKPACDTIFKMTNHRLTHNGVWTSFRGQTYWLCDVCNKLPEIEAIRRGVTKEFLEKEARD